MIQNQRLLHLLVPLHHAGQTLDVKWQEVIQLALVSKITLALPLIVVQNAF
jgi:hypothetical protein